jgi:dephospho-CoA kinase
MIVIGLSGGVASGKDFVAEVFRKRKRALVFDADKIVHKLLTENRETILQIKEKFPEVFLVEKIDRKKLSNIVFNNQDRLRILEKIIHPLVRKEYQIFLKKAKKKRVKFVIVNVPLLLETKSYKCDKIISINLSQIKQKFHFLNREKKKNKLNYTTKELEKKFDQIKKNQLSLFQRNKKSDYKIYSISKEAVIRQINQHFKNVNFGK